MTDDSDPWDDETVEDYVEAESSLKLPRSKLTDLTDDPTRRQRKPMVSNKPNVEHLVGGMMAVTMHMMGPLLQKVKDQVKLDPAEERLAHKLVDDVKKLTAEQREQQKFEKLEEMDQSKLEEKYLAAGKVLGLLPEAPADLAPCEECGRTDKPLEPWEGVAHDRMLVCADCAGTLEMEE